MANENKSEPLEPAGGRLPTEIRLMIWSAYFEVTTLCYHTLISPTYNFAHAPPLLDTTALFRSEALPYYFTRLHAELEQEETRYRSYLGSRPADNCPEPTYNAWVDLLERVEGHIRALRREIKTVRVEIYGVKVKTEKTLLEDMANLDLSD